MCSTDVIPILPLTAVPISDDFKTVRTYVEESIPADSNQQKDSESALDLSLIDSTSSTWLDDQDSESPYLKHIWRRCVCWKSMIDHLSKSCTIEGFESLKAIISNSINIVPLRQKVLFDSSEIEENPNIVMENNFLVLGMPIFIAQKLSFLISRIVFYLKYPFFLVKQRLK